MLVDTVTACLRIGHHGKLCAAHILQAAHDLRQLYMSYY